VCLKGGSPFSYPKLTHPAHKVSRSTTDLLFELILHDFSGGVQRQRVEEFDVSWRFEAGHPGRGPGRPFQLWTARSLTCQREPITPDVTVSYDD
jgi:hypothetical protein